DAGVAVPRGPVRVHDGIVFVELDGEDFMARDIDAEGDQAPLSVKRTLVRFATIAARRGCTQRWYFWHDGAPAGMAYFVTPEELITSTGIDMRELNTAESWHEVQPD
nr:hypothetical protein [Streptomyces sp. DSM 41633]